MGRLGHSFVSLDHGSAIQALQSLAVSRDERAPFVYVNILEGMALSSNGGKSIRLPLAHGELTILEGMGVRCGLLECTRPARWVAVYEHPDGEGVTDQVTVRTPDRPPKRKVFKAPTGGRRRYNRVSSRRIREGVSMATKSKTRGKKNEVEVEELEGLEELEELESELDEEEDEPKPKRSRKRKTKTAVVEEEESDSEDEDEDTDDEEDEDDEEPEPAPKKRRSRKSKSQPAEEKPAKKSKGKADSKGKAKSKGKGGGLPSTKPLPDGRVGIEHVAKLAKVEPKDVRIYCHKNGVEKKDGRYSFTESQAEKLAKKIKGD